MRTKLTWLCVGALMGVLALGAAQHLCREAEAMPWETAVKKYTPDFHEWAGVYLSAHLNQSYSDGHILVGVCAPKGNKETRFNFTCRYADTKLGQKILRNMVNIRTKTIPSVVKLWQAKGFKIKESDFEYDIKPFERGDE